MVGLIRRMEKNYGPDSGIILQDVIQNDFKSKTVWFYGESKLTYGRYGNWCFVKTIVTAENYKYVTFNRVEAKHSNTYRINNIWIYRHGISSVFGTGGEYEHYLRV